MVLSDTDINEFISRGDIKITSFNSEMIKPGSYTFTLNDTLFIPKEEKLVDIKSYEPSYKEIKIEGGGGYVINPGDFLLGQTKEMLSISQNLACMLDARTSLARIGLNVLQGSTFIQPGQSESYETLEISNISGSPIKIYSGMKIVKCIFMLLKSKSIQNYSETGEYGKQSKVNAILK